MTKWATGSAEEFLEDIMNEKCLICGEEIPIGLQHECQNEHVHKWLIGWEPEIGEILARCERISVCDASMGLDEILKRVNATERLCSSSAIQASRGQGLRGYVVKSLLAYADILDGKDD